MTAPGELFQAAEAEVRAFHEAVERWFRGEEQDFARIGGALAADFSITTPDGRQIAEPLVSDWLRSAMGSRDKAFRIRIERLRLVVETAEIVAVIYDERQRLDGAETLRHATAVFRRDPAAPHGLRWVRVHETWIDRPLPSSEKA